MTISCNKIRLLVLYSIHRILRTCNKFEYSTSTIQNEYSTIRISLVSNRKDSYYVHMFTT